MAGKGAADEAATTERAQERPARKARGGFNAGLIILGVALLFIATMGSAFLAVTFLGRADRGAAPAAAPAAEAQKEAAQFGPTQEIGNFTVNLADAGERVFVKAGVAVELSNAEVGPELTSRDPQVKDIVINVLSARTMADVSSLEGKDALKKEIRDKVNRLLTKGKVRSVFFTEFVFQ